MSVKYIRPEVTRLLPIYRMIRDVIAGPAHVKAAGVKYLPHPEPQSDNTGASKARYENYLQRAQFFDATSRTHEGYLGQVFYRDPQVELPPLLEVLLEDADGSGVGLIQQSKEAVGTVLSLGRAGIYVDYSSQGSPVTRAEQERGSVRATISLMQPEDIINWRWSMWNNRRILSLLVIHELYDEDDDGYEAVKSSQWRELRLVVPEGGTKPLLMCVVWRENKEGLYSLEPTFPRKGNGEPWDTIPFEFIGSKDNSPEPDKPPMEGMAHINIGHYRNSAEYEESVFMIGQPTPWGSGLTENWVKEAWNSELRLGSREFIPLPAGGQMGLLQPAPNTMAKEAMEMKRDQMVALGAKLAENATVASTATQENRESVIENSVLSTCAKNVTAAYMKALSHAAIYSNIPTEGLVFEINTDFEITRMSAQDRQQLLTEWQGGGITWEEYRWNVKRSGVAFEDDLKARAKIEGELKKGVPLDFPEEKE